MSNVRDVELPAREDEEASRSLARASSKEMFRSGSDLPGFRGDPCSSSWSTLMVFVSSLSDKEVTDIEGVDV